MPMPFMGSAINGNVMSSTNTSIWGKQFCCKLLPSNGLRVVKAFGDVDDQMVDELNVAFQGAGFSSMGNAVLFDLRDVGVSVSHDKALTSFFSLPQFDRALVSVLINTPLSTAFLYMLVDKARRHGSNIRIFSTVSSALQFMNLTQHVNDVNAAVKIMEFERHTHA